MLLIGSSAEGADLCCYMSLKEFLGQVSVISRNSGDSVEYALNERDIAIDQSTPRLKLSIGLASDDMLLRHQKTVLRLFLYQIDFPFLSQVCLQEVGAPDLQLGQRVEMLHHEMEGFGCTNCRLF